MAVWQRGVCPGDGHAPSVLAVSFGTNVGVAMTNAVSSQLPVLWREAPLRSAGTWDEKGTAPVPGAENYRQLTPVPPVKRRSQEPEQEQGPLLDQNGARVGRFARPTETDRTPPRPEGPPPASAQREPRPPPPTFTGYGPRDNSGAGFSAQALGQDNAEAETATAGRKFRERAAQSYRRAAALPEDKTFSQDRKSVV